MPLDIAFDPDSITARGEHFIDGAFVKTDEEAIAVLRPSDQRPLGTVYDASPDTVDRAVQAAKKAFKTSDWATQAPRERAKVLRRWADLIAEAGAPLARLESAGSTRMIAETLVRDVNVASDLIRFYAEYADKMEGQITATQAEATSLVFNEPYGVVGAVVPWNFPLINAVVKLGPALAAGNTIVIKPSEMTPFTTLRLAELSIEAGLPAGVVNVVNGYGAGAGAAIVRHPDVKKISFTGSTRTGMAIMGDAAAHGTKPVTLELGGKSPMVVFDDGKTLDDIAPHIARGFLGNAGQICTTGSRLIVQRSMKDALLERVAGIVSKARSGPTWAADTELPPIISDRQIERLEDLVRRTIEEGATLVTGGARDEAMNEGAYFRPTILDGVTEDMTGFKEEFFGPILSVSAFDDYEEAVAMADHPVYGLASSIFTSDINKAFRLARSIESGTVWINRHSRPADFATPAGGYKGSGFGKDWGRAGIEGYLRQKSVWIEHG